MSTSSGRGTGVEDVEAYLEELDDDKRSALERLRQVIRDAAPDAEECMSYGLPAFRQQGVLVSYGAASGHCSFYPMSDTTVAEHQRELSKYDTSKGTIRFRPDSPLPDELVTRLVKARLAENLARGNQ